MSPQRYTARAPKIDPLTSLVRMHLSRPRWVYRCSLPSPGSVAVPAGYGAFLHVVVSGTIHLQLGGATRTLGPGDAVLLTARTAHTLSTDGSGVASRPVAVPPPPPSQGSRGARVQHFGPSEGTTTILCTPVTGIGGGRAPFFELLPDIVESAAADEALAPVISLLDAACTAGELGDAALAMLYAEALLLLVLQQHFQGEHRSTLQVLHDPRLMRAMSALHEKIAHPWTVRELSRVAGMSESLFRSRLRAAVGEPWRSYVQRVRIRRAQHLLTMPDASVAGVASEVGYLSESSFSRAFLGLVGTRPGQVIARQEGATPTEVVDAHLVPPPT